MLTMLVVFGLFLYTWQRLHKKINIHAQNSEKELPPGLMAQTRYTTNPSNQKIAYWYFPVKNARAVVVLIHGYSNPGGKSQMLDHVAYLHEAGYSSVALDLRSFGESEGNKMTLGVNEWRDVEVVYDAIKLLPENMNQKIGFFGISMGASTAIMTAGKTKKGDFLIATVPYADFRSAFYAQINAAGFPPTVIYPLMRIAAKFELGKNYENFVPLKVVSKINIPTLYISAKRDEEVSSQDAKTLYDLANEPKDYWEVDSRHDIYNEYPREFKERILTFLQNSVE